jgi:DUF1680 family protein
MAHETADRRLLEKIERLLTRWLATQGPDGYLGTFSANDRWKSWDLWAVAHAMSGLLVYYDVFRQPRALVAARRLADCLLAGFGPGRASVQLTGHHHGLSSSSVLEPVVLLFRYTGDGRYLAFAKWLVDEDWEAPTGPKTLSTLASGAGVRAVGNGKALEMLLTLVGLVELFRETDEQRYFDAADAAWRDIVENYLYITGSASVGEYFGDPVLPNDGANEIGETCVTMAWISLCLHLHRLTGDARYFEPAERATYNHLLAAQSEDGRGWAYYVGLRDYKRYREHTDPGCCPSRGSRAISMLPGAALGLGEGGIFLDLFEPLSATVELARTGLVQLEVRSDYPFEGSVTIEVGLERAATFALCLRKPRWCRSWAVMVDGSAYAAELDSHGYLCITREWAAVSRVELSLEMLPKVIGDASGNSGRVAFVRGPLVFAADVASLVAGRLLEDVAVDLAPDTEAVRCVSRHGGPTDGLEVRMARLAVGDDPAFEDASRYRVLSEAKTEADGYTELVPFYEAGNRQADSYRSGVWSNREFLRRPTYQVWLPVVVASPLA